VNKLKPHLTYANVVATLALIVAVSGGATAVAVGLGKGSVGPKQLRKGAVRAQELGPVIVRSQSGPGISQGFATCKKGERVLSGGGTVTSTSGGGAPVLFSSTPAGARSWKVSGAGETGPVTATAHALCLRK
jgi:hypothetical protein